MVRAIILSTLMFTLAGCATLTTIASNPVVQAGVKWALIDYMANKPDKASQAEQLIIDLKAHTDSRETFTVSDLEDFTIDWIDWNEMSKADQSFVLDMIVVTSNQLRSMVGDGLITEDHKIRVDQFFDWILQAIRFAQ